MIDEIKHILQLEQNRFENRSKLSNEVSFLRSIENLSSKVKDYIITIMQSLSICLSDSLDLLFLNWLLECISFELFRRQRKFD